MTELPASIEAALVEAEFTSTEILVLKRLLEEDALTLRQLAACTGKSTGVLDQAVKKLLRKGILSKEGINETKKCSIGSLYAIQKWMAEDTRRKREMLLRRHQNFEAFIASIKQDKKRPDIQNYEGLEGFKQAYSKLLEEKTEILQYLPVEHKLEEHPLSVFLADWFRERRRRGLFARVIGHATPLGRRFQSRDPFEYRKTLLVPEAQYPFAFETVIVGNVVGCFNLKEQRACLIRYPELANMERGLFEGIWQHIQAGEALTPAGAKSSPAPSPPVPLSAKLKEEFKRFFWSGSSLITFAVFAMLSAAMTYGLYRYTAGLNVERAWNFLLSLYYFVGLFLIFVLVRLAAFNWSLCNALLAQATARKIWFSVSTCAALSLALTYGIYRYNARLNFEGLRQKVIAIAATAATQFSFADLNELRTESDVVKPVYKTITKRLDDIRKRNSKIIYAYIVRPTFVKDTFAFVADADAIDPYARPDTNHDGVVDDSDTLELPGLPYDVSGIEVLRDKTYFIPNANSSTYTDKWGTFLTGYAPIKDNLANIRAILAIDIDGDDIAKLNAKTFNAIGVFLLFFVLFLLVRWMTFNTNALHKMLAMLTFRQALVGISFVVVYGIIGIYILHFYIFNHLKEDLGNRLFTIVSRASSEFDAEDIMQLHIAADMKKEAYQRVFQKLNEVRARDPNIKYAYIMRPTNNPKIFEFVADADSNYNLPFVWKDFNEDDFLDEADENVAPGVQYDTSYSLPFLLKEGLKHPTLGEDFVVDQWGKFITSVAPIKDKNGVAIAVLAMDIDAANLYRDARKIILIPWF